MKKKMFSLIAIVLFICNSIDATPFIESETDCYDKVEIAIIQADNAGLSAYEITWIANAFEAHYCYGYSWEDIFSLGY